MKRLTAVTIAAALVAATPASAAVVLTRHEAKQATKQAVEPMAGLLDRNAGGTARVKISGCRVAHRRGTCQVLLVGTSTCSATSHVIEAPNGDHVVWLDRVVCR